MKNAIKEYIEPTSDEKQELWDRAVFVFDTNVFLDLYRFSKKTREMLIDAMKRLSDRIWMPNHVAHEFMKDRYKIVSDTVKGYVDLQTDLEKLQKNFADSLRLKDSDPDYTELKDNIKNIQAWLEKHQQDNVIVTNTANDSILDALLSLYDGKVGEGFSDKELAEIKTEGAKRYKQKIPPGYKDAPKANADHDNNAYGDLIVWKEILKYAAEKKVDIIFVTHDCKEDWWNIIHGKTVGPRVELRKEFIDSTSQKFLMYNMDTFLRQSEIQQGRKIDPGIVTEVQAVNQSEPAESEENRMQQLQMDFFKETCKLQDELKCLEQKTKERQTALKILEIKYNLNGRPDDIRREIESTQADYNRDKKRIAYIEYNLDHMKEIDRLLVSMGY